MGQQVVAEDWEVVGDWEVEVEVEGDWEVVGED